MVHAHGHCYKSGHGLVPLHWVYVQDRTGTHRPEYFFSTDVERNAVALVEHYTGR